MNLHWDAGVSNYEVVDPLWEFVERRILDLDGSGHTLVTIFRGSQHLAVGGAVESGLVVYCADADEQYWQLTVPSQVNLPDVEVVAGGQAGDYPAEHVVTVDLALEAAEFFATSGGTKPSLQWQSGA